MTQAEVRALYDKYSTWLNRYKGGMPAGFLAAIMSHESGGRPDAKGDASLGEVGLFQIEASFPPKVGLAPEVRYDPETNVFLGGLEYNLRAIEFLPYASLGSADSWKLARLGFAVGSSGTRRLIDAATGGNPSAYRGRVFDQIRTWANQTGAMALSSGQPAEKVVKRINAVADQWAIGQSVAGSYSSPQKTPAPKGMLYAIPASAARYLKSSPWTSVLILGAAAVVGFFVYKNLTAQSANA